MEKVTETIKVEELRSIAKQLGVKNIKTFKKVELIKIVNDIIEKQQEEEIKAAKAAEEKIIEESKETTENVSKKRSSKLSSSTSLRLRKEYGIPEHCSLPQGEASVDIYEEILKHKNYKKWRMYRLTKRGYSYTNIRRVWKLYIEPYLDELGFEERYKDLKQRW